MKRILLLLVLLSPAIVPAQENSDEPVTVEPKEQTEPKEKALDRHKEAVDTQIRRASGWVDKFFGDRNYFAETATTMIRIRPEIYYRKEQGAKPRGKVGLKFSLPNLGRKTSLVIGSDDSIDNFGDNVEDDDREAVIGLQFFGRSTRRWNSSLSVGVKFNEFAGYIGPRVRYMTPWGKSKSIRLTQSVRYQTNDYWNTISRVDFNFILGGRFFFRQTFDGRWRGDRSNEEGFHTRVSSILTQRLQSTAGLQYDFTTIFHTRPETHVDRYTLAVRFRKGTSRDWLYYEIAPQVSFEDEYDYSFNPGIRLRVEIFYGAQSTTNFSKRELEDTEEFRW